MNKLRENHIVFKNKDQYDLKIFSEVFRSNILKFRKLVDNISSYNKNDLHWLSQTALSRNNYLSSIYFDYCRLEVLKKKLKKKTVNIIYVENNKEKRAIEINFSKKYQIKIINKQIKNFKDQKIYRVLQNLYVNFKTSIIFFLNKSKKRKENFLKKKKITLVENFFNKLVFDNKPYSDRFYGSFFNYLDKKQKEKVFFLFQNSNILKLKKHISILDKYKLNYITIFDFLNIFDYLFAILVSLKKENFKKKKISLNNLNLAFLFQDLYDQTFNDINSFKSYLQFLFFKRLRKEINFKKFYQVIDWYENQSIDKGFNFGIKKFFPQIKSVGYEPFALDFNFYSHLIPTKIERKNNLTPDKIALMGKKIKRYLTKKFDLKKNTFILAPALRYESIFKKKTNLKINKKNRNILLALPISNQDSNDILNVVQNYLKKIEKNKYRFFVNFHPMLDFKSLKNNNEIIKKHVKVIYGGFNKIYDKFDCVVSNSSSICVEALALSKPVVIVQNSISFTQNPISMISKDTWKFVKNEKDLQKALEDLLQKKQKKFYYKNSRFIKNEYFSKIDKKKIIKFLGLEQK